MTLDKVSMTWKSTNPLDEEGLLTEEEGVLVGSWIHSRVYVYGTDLAPVDAFMRLMDSGTRSLKRRYEDYPSVSTAGVVWGWAATEEGLGVTRTSRGGGIDAGWQACASAQVKGRWVTQTPGLHLSWRTCALYTAVPHAVGVSRESVRSGWCLTYATLRGLFHSVRRTYADLPKSLYYADVLWMAFFGSGFAHGDVVRRKSLCGAINWGWWDEFSPDLEQYLPWDVPGQGTPGLCGRYPRCYSVADTGSYYGYCHLVH